NADGEIPVTRDDLIDYWKQARHTAEKARLEHTPLQVEVKYGPRGNRQTAIVTLNGFTMSDKLTPKLARAALRIVGATDGIVWTLPKPDPETGELLYWRSEERRVGKESRARRSSCQ